MMHCTEVGQINVLLKPKIALVSVIGMGCKGLVIYASSFCIFIMWLCSWPAGVQADDVSQVESVEAQAKTRDLADRRC